MILPPARLLRNAALYLIGTASCVVFIHVVTSIAGAETISLYLRTSYRTYPLLLLGLPAAAGLLCLIIAFLFIRDSLHGNAARPYPALQITAALLLLACVVSAGLFFRQQARRYAGAPGAPERLQARIGPVAQPGPFRDRRADASCSMVIWYFDPTRNTLPAEIEFGADTAAAPLALRRETADGDGRRHEFRLTGLLPGVRYRYRAPAGSGAWRFFTTAPVRGAVLRFLCLADTGNTLAGGGALSYYGEVTRAAAGLFRATGIVPSFMVHAGDLVRTGMDLGGWAYAFSSNALADSIPFIAAPGNHDFLEDGGANFRYFFNRPDYCSIDYGDCRIILLHPYDGPGTTLDGPVICSGEEQYRWLTRELSRPRDGRWLIVVLHNPILSTGDYGVNELLAEQYLSLFREKRVDLVVSGHDHNFDAFLADGGSPWGGTLYLVTGTGGSHLDAAIMEQHERRWLDWRQDRSTGRGPYQSDYFTRNFHLYGELSWGFTEVELGGGVMTVTYRRWLSFPRFLEITGQDRRSWDMVRLDAGKTPHAGITGLAEAWTFRKKRGK